MGTDIYGWVEIHQAGWPEWDGAIRIDDIVQRAYGMFASLFGVRNGDPEHVTAVGRFRAIAPGRGMPPDVSPSYPRETTHGEGQSWALWSELAAIDWEEEGERYIVEEWPGRMYSEPGPGRRRERRGDYFASGWETLFRLMEVLAEQFGADNVRLSVWFDEV
jgi:hypothetical protein